MPCDTISPQTARSSTNPHHSASPGTISHGRPPLCTVPHCAAALCTGPQRPALSRTAPYCPALSRNALHCPAPLCTIPRCPAFAQLSAADPLRPLASILGLSLCPCLALARSYGPVHTFCIPDSFLLARCRSSGGGRAFSEKLIVSEKSDRSRKPKTKAMSKEST